MIKKIKRVGLFVIITFILSWLTAILFFVLGGKWGTLNAMVIATMFMFMPMVSTILVQKAICKEP